MVLETSTEQEMRDADVPRFSDIDNLSEYINSLINRKHDYGTCVYATSLAATAAFYYVAHKLGISGFQASCADMDVLRRVRRIKGPFILLNGEDMLYPQYDLPSKLREAMNEWAEWAASQAIEKMNESNQEGVHPDVWAHWEALSKI